MTPPTPKQDPWFKNWNIGISPGMEELPEYPKAEDATTSGDIARAWHQMQKDFAHQTLNENFPSYRPHKPQPFEANQSYQDYMNEHQTVLKNLDPFFLNGYQRAKPQAFSLFGKAEEPAPESIPQPEFKEGFENAEVPGPQKEEEVPSQPQQGKWLPRSDKPYPGVRAKTSEEIRKNDMEFETTLNSMNIPDSQKALLREIRKYENSGAGPEDYRIHHPGGPSSGPSEGMGVDWGQPHRNPSTIEQQALNAGYSASEAKARAQAYGKRGVDSVDYVRDNRDSLAAPTHEQAIKLALDDPQMKIATKRIENLAKARPLSNEQQGH
ncbi:MAG: hypothetical protein AB7G80_04805 [Dongiaceae bacterium]